MIGRHLLRVEIHHKILEEKSKYFGHFPLSQRLKFPLLFSEIFSVVIHFTLKSKKVKTSKKKRREKKKRSSFVTS